MDKQFWLLLRAYVLFTDNYKKFTAVEDRKQVFKLRREIEQLIFDYYKINITDHEMKTQEGNKNECQGQEFEQEPIW